MIEISTELPRDRTPCTQPRKKENKEKGKNIYYAQLPGALEKWRKAV